MGKHASEPDGLDPISMDDHHGDESAAGLPASTDGEAADALPVKIYKLQHDLNKRLDRYLCDRLPGLSRSALQKLINGGSVIVNGRKPKSSTTLRIGDEVKVTVPPPPLKQIPAEDIPLNVLYEDDDLIIVNKQANFVVHPARSNQTGTMVNALAWYFRDVKDNGLEALSNVGVEAFRPGVVHRLDKDTTGAIIFAKNEWVHAQLNRQFEKRQVQKYYLAVVHGQLGEPGDVIDQPIGKHLNVAEAYSVRQEPYGRRSVTIYRVREVFDGYSLVELELKTGRTHQIRVHLTWMGFPIVSDIIYGGEPINEAAMNNPPIAAGSQPYLTYARAKPEGQKIWQQIDEATDMFVRRPLLHAAVLQFRHPRTEAWVDITAPLPMDMANMIHTLRKERPVSGPLKAEGACVDLSRSGL